MLIIGGYFLPGEVISKIAFGDSVGFSKEQSVWKLGKDSNTDGPLHLEARKKLTGVCRIYLTWVLGRFSGLRRGNDLNKSYVDNR